MSSEIQPGDPWANAKARGEIRPGYQKTLTDPIPVAQCRGFARSTGARCKRWGLRGTTKVIEVNGEIITGGLCLKHGGALPHVQEHAAASIEAAQLRIINLSDMAIDVLEDLANNSTADQVRLGAAKDLLDRAGLKGAETFKVEVSHEGETAAERTQRTLNQVVARLEEAKERERKAQDDVVDAEVVEDLPADE